MIKVRITLAASLVSVPFIAGAAVGASNHGSIYRRWFQTPSHNIKCIASAANIHLTCVVLSTGFHPWPKQFTMHVHGRARSWRPSDTETTAGPSRVLPYGTKLTIRIHERPAFYVHSETVGLTCRNLSGHGFFLSRERQRTF